MKLLVLLSVLFVSNAQAVSLSPVIIMGPAADELYARGFVDGESSTINCIDVNGDIECSLKAFVKMPMPDINPRMCTMQYVVMFNPRTGKCANGSNGCVISDLRKIGYRPAQGIECNSRF